MRSSTDNIVQYDYDSSIKAFISLVEGLRNIGENQADLFNKSLNVIYYSLTLQRNIYCISSSCPNFSEQIVINMKGVVNVCREQIKKLSSIIEEYINQSNQNKKLFIEFFRNFKQRNYEFGYPILHAAIMFGKPEMVRLLLNAGADISCRCRDGHDALSFAEMMNIDEIKNIIFEHHQKILNEKLMIAQKMMVIGDIVYPDHFWENNLDEQDAKCYVEMKNIYFDKNIDLAEKWNAIRKIADAVKPTHFLFKYASEVISISSIRFTEFCYYIRNDSPEEFHEKYQNDFNCRSVSKSSCTGISNA